MLWTASTTRQTIPLPVTAGYENILLSSLHVRYSTDSVGQSR